MNKYKIRDMGGKKASIDADFFELLDDKRVVFYKEDPRDSNPSGYEIVAMFDRPVSVEEVK